ncbi:transporter substrate-binding domain-containing protein [Streptomyces sp. 3MP-14]|uniref:Transporter substrate-binding domain-containing protein n=1 Tax=Streptomyces mimosae TaxID=2586635 RepID=A0A5N6A8T7_9ACTN|nr:MULTISPECIES: bifunctional serine/threonine-protein kinase/glutamate ABC transporter substrate-binding protein [Streptomyces]KAB8164685.1 transporter substrate-binding domain-containing protein [Streptomyces mimosae]KAB8175601.1 transporter substrate-binding domain-containing protein [Streptomyces sp. 3MP-14]
MEPLSDQDPRRLGEFTLLARLGSGGMGRVYLGRSPGGMQVAIKVIREDIAEDSGVLARFRREVATVRAVRSPYTARLVAASLDAPPHWLATEFVPGPTLLRASRGTPLEPALCVGLFAALAEALAAVHAHGVVHRDVKPHNVILSPGGPQLIDFGIARAAEHTVLTHTGQTPGTVGYTAPEVLLGGPAGPAADVFALGATMAAAATGRPPYGAGEWPVVSYRVVHGEVDVEGVEPRLAELIRGCVAREPGDRPDPAEIVRRCAVSFALAEYPPYRRLLESAVPAPPPPPTHPAHPAHPPATRRRRPPLLAVGGLAAGGLTVALLLWLLPDGESGNGGNGGAAGESPVESPDESSDEGGVGEGGEDPSGNGDGSGDDNGEGGDGGRLTVGVKFDQPGLGVQDVNGELSGFEVEVARYVAAELGFDEDDIDWVEAPAADRENLLRRGEVDLVVATYTITEDREAVVDFAGPYLTAHQDLLIRADDEVADVAAINDLTLCSVTGSTSALNVRDGLAPGVQLEEADTWTECLAALDEGRVDALTNDDALLVSYATRAENAGDYRLAGLGLSTDYQYGIGIPEGETELRDEINAALSRMIEDGSWEAALQAHLTGVADYDPSPPEL